MGFPKPIPFKSRSERNQWCNNNDNNNNNTQQQQQQQGAQRSWQR